MAWFWTFLKMIGPALAGLIAGRASQRQADKEATNAEAEAAETRIAVARVAAPTDDAGVSRSLHDGTF